MNTNVSVSTRNAPTELITVGETTYAYRRLGREGGVPLLALQHFTGTLDEWDPAVIDPLAEGRAVILFENAGVGRSTGTTPNTIDGMAAHAIAFLDALGLAQVDILGFSLGGFIAQRILATPSDAIPRVSVSCAAPVYMYPSLLYVTPSGQIIPGWVCWRNTRPAITRPSRSGGEVLRLWGGQRPSLAPVARRGGCLTRRRRATCAAGRRCSRRRSRARREGGAAHPRR